MPSVSSPGRQRLAGLVLAAGAVALVLIAAEILARALGSDPPAPSLRPPTPVNSDYPVLQKLADIYNKKNVRGYWRGIFVRTNSLTLRGPNYASQPAPGVFRIAIGGDSFTMGLGVDEADTYPMQLQGLLEADGRSLRPQVLNVGLSGININYAVSRLGEAAKFYHPNLLVYGFTANDIEDRNYKKIANGAVDAAINLSRQRFDDSSSVLLRLLWPRWVSLHEVLSPSPGSYLQELEYNYFENEPAWADVQLGLDRFAEIARTHGVCGHVLIHSSLGELGWLHPERRIYDRLATAARERGLTVTESFPYFRGRRAADLWVRPFDPHPNVEGNAILARALHDGLRDLPEACWSPDRKP